MLDWLRKKSAAYKASQKMADEATPAYQAGKEASAKANASLDQYMDTRFRPVFNSYLDVLRGDFENCISSFSPEQNYRHQAPPIAMAGIAYQNFLDEVGELQPKMLSEIQATMRRWLEFADEVAARNLFRRLIIKRIDDFQMDLMKRGLELFTEMADRLKAADEEWRVANPEMSARFPPPD